MELVAALFYQAVLRHECSHLESFILYALSEVAALVGYVGGRDVG